jgi:hypothetical protein
MLNRTQGPPYFWHCRCPETRGEMSIVEDYETNDKTAEEMYAGKAEPLKFRCRFCGKEHMGHLASWQFGIWRGRVKSIRLLHSRDRTVAVENAGIDSARGDRPNR